MHSLRLIESYDAQGGYPPEMLIGHDDRFPDADARSAEMEVHGR